MIKKEAKLSEDEMRRKILEYFYSLHKKASFPKNARKSIKEIKLELKSELEGKDIVRNLQYLVDTNYIKKEVEESKFTSRKGFTTTNKKEFYRAGDKTINYFEGISEFQSVDKSISGINLSNISGIVNIVSGDSNVLVNENFQTLYRELDNLIQLIKISNDLTAEGKLQHISDIETIQAQLKKKKPIKEIISVVWKSLQALSTITTLSGALIKISPLISSLI